MSAEPIPAEWMEPEEAAKRLPGIAPSTLIAHARLRKIPHHKYGRKTFFTPEDVKAIKDQSYVPPAPLMAQTDRSRRANR